ncbi:gliding motility-associated C-terminal domain-containing protein, partial [Algibacter sp.]|uniref:T9SS type B sorting domain-containing protein n=1 Tax=Algibacter sp. TaxID=1872428 RepID=UPI003C70AA29
TDATNVTLGTPTTDDNCSTTTVTNDAPRSFPIGDTTVTWTVTDTAGNTATCTQTVTVEDNENPTFITCAADVSVNVDINSCETIASNATLGAPTTNDNCSVVTVTNDAPTSFPIGETTVTWTVTDGSGNTATCTQIVTVTDDIDPIFVESLPTDLTLECNDVTAPETLTATDNCGSAVVTFSEIRIDGSCSSDYILERTWTATDNSGLTISYTQTITVSDTTAPVLLTNLNTELTISCSEIPEVPNLEFADNCSTNVNVEFEETNTYDEKLLSDYEIIRTWTVTDECNNQDIFTQVLNIKLDNVVNQISERACVGDGTINLNDYLANNKTAGSSWIIIEGSAELDDNILDTKNLDLGYYTFSYTESANGCLNTTEITIELHDECVVYPCGREDVVISKVITPNGDMHNEFLTVSGIDACGFTVDLKIFNRWGAKIYENSDYKNDWNGQVHSSSVGNADKVPTGTYYYVVSLMNSGLEPMAKAFYVGSN